MFEPYEITYNGRTYHGNVTLKEHHIVERDGEYSLFRVPDMAAVPVSRALVEAMLRMLPSPGTLIPDELMMALQECGLAVRTKDSEKESADPPAAGETPASSDLPVVNIALFLTQACNMRCAYCYGNGGEYGERGVMTLETAIAAVDWLMENSLDEKKVRIGFFGGEPLMNFSLMRQVVAYAKEQATARGKKIAFKMTTNGSLITNKIITFMKEEKIEPLISFDGPPEIQNRQRPFKNGRGSYNRVFANIQKLRKVFPKLMARATVNGDSDPFAIRKGIENAGFLDCHLSPASPVILKGAADKDGVTIRAVPAERMLAYRREELNRLFIAISERNLDPRQPPSDLVRLAGLADSRKRHSGCGIGRGLHAVAVNGDIYPCHRFVGLENVRLGDVRNYRVGGINNYHRAVVENLPVCRTCWARYLCGGGCFYHNQASTGDMHRPDPLYCRETTIVAEDMIHGWRRLNEDDKNYVREQVNQIDSHLRN